MRNGDEVHYMQGRTLKGEIETVRVTPEHSLAINPAFDVTPAKLVTGIITERGVCSPNSLAQLFKD